MKLMENDYSEPIQEILGRIPSWITRWGICMILGIFACLFIAASIIKQPLVVSSPIVVYANDSVYRCQKLNLISTSIIDNLSSDSFGIMELNSLRIGKLKMGQKVRIKLHAFPYMEYGVLEAQVSYISNVPSYSNGMLKYEVIVEIPNGLINKNIKHDYLLLDGVAEIIVTYTSIISQIFKVKSYKVDI